MPRKFCGKTQDEMRQVLFFLCDIEDEIDHMTDAEQEMFDVAVQCVTTIINRMDNDHPISWDEE